MWSGSATVLPGGEPILVYTGNTKNGVQLQNLAAAEDPSDPLLRNWVKFAHNPIASTPADTSKIDFRDPSTAWMGEDGLWRY